MDYSGPTHSISISQPGVAGVNFVQELLAMVGDEYALLGYTPTTNRTVMIFVDGAFQLQGTAYNIDGRKIQFVVPLIGGEVVTASYNTLNTVASIPAVTIAFDIPGADVRVGSAGNLQILVTNGDADPGPETFSWHDMLPSVHPITGVITYDVDEDVSLNQ